MLQIKNLQVSVEEKTILQGLNLDVGDGEVHVLMGPNGSGKSTLAQTLMGNPSYIVKDGVASFNGKNLLDMDPSQRSLEGIFLSFQYPSEVPGVKVESFLRLIYNKHKPEKLSPIKFRQLLKEKLSLLKLDESFTQRYLNDGFSGGEKKRMEMLQMLVLEPKLAILDEIDSGLDVDAIKVLAKVINYLKEKDEMSVLLITHYSRILKNIGVDKISVMKRGAIVQDGGRDLAEELEEHGYSN